MQTDRYDVLVIGGGPAGLAGAVALARSKRSVVVVDAAEPRNAAADGVHNYLGREGTPPAELLALGREELRSYGGVVLPGAVTAVRAEDGGNGDGLSFVAGLADGRSLRARRVLAAPGAVDVLPEVPGLRERWGRDVVHCPYCHGWEVRDRRIVVLATGPMAVHQALMFRQLSEYVQLLMHDQAEPAEADAERLAVRGIDVVRGRATALEVTDDHLQGVRLATGELVPCEVLAVASVVRVRGEMLAPLGLVPEDVVMAGQVIGSAFPAGPTGATAVPGVFVVGNAVEVSAQVLGSAAAGMRAGALLNADLIEEDVRLALDRTAQAA